MAASAFSFRLMAGAVEVGKPFEAAGPARTFFGSFTGAFCGFVVIYCLPVICYLKKKYTEITNPVLAEAIALNEHRVVTSK